LRLRMQVVVVDDSLWYLSYDVLLYLCSLLISLPQDQGVFLMTLSVTSQSHPC